MSTSNNTSHDDTTYFIDAENAAEMARLMVQDRLTTKAMGGLLPEQANLSAIHDILDIACGPGGWVLDVAQAYPEMQVTGIDVSKLMIEYAQAQARAQGVSNASFQVMDALKPLAFPANAFDLVNMRFAVAFMPKAGWSPLLKEALRITRPGGIIRLTEFEAPVTNSPAVTKLASMLSRSLWRAGQSFSPDGQNLGITMMLARLLREAGCVNVQQMAHIMDYSIGTEAYASNYHNVMTLYKLLQPFFIKVGVTTQEEVNQVYHQALEEMRSEDYTGVIFFLTAWGTKPA